MTRKWRQWAIEESCKAAKGAWLAAACALSVASVQVRAAEPAKDEPMTELFPDDGVPKGWVVRQWDDLSKPAEGEWTVKGGVLTSGAERGMWLVNEREFEDFDLEYEFKLGPRGNSGLALRAPMKGDPAFDGLEVQMVDKRYNEEAKDSELTGGLYRAVAPRKQVYKPTEWNRYEISLRGPRLRVTLNGELIHDLELDRQEQIVKRHDGTDAPPIKDRPKRGHIGFQQLSRDGGIVQIRNARMRVLK